MENLTQKIKSFYVGMMKKKETYQRHGVKPTRDWTTLLIIGFIIFVFLAAFAFYLFLQIKDDKLFITTDMTTLRDVKIDTNLLNKTIDDINAREQATKNLKNNKITSPNPSL